jgi:hypothetical protein
MSPNVLGASLTQLSQLGDISKQNEQLGGDKGFTVNTAFS